MTGQGGEVRLTVDIADFACVGRQVLIRGCFLEGEASVEEAFGKSRRRSLLEHFGAVKARPPTPSEAWTVRS